MSDEHRDEVTHWVGKARSDRLNVENNIAADDVPWDTVCFHCQQAAEKLLKALLAQAGLDVPRTHDLLDLARRCAEAYTGHDWRATRAGLEILNPYAVAARYGDPPFSEGETEGREAHTTLVNLWTAVEPLLLPDPPTSPSRLP